MQAFHKSHLLKLRVAPSETAMTDVLREVFSAFYAHSIILAFYFMYCNNSICLDFLVTYYLSPVLLYIFLVFHAGVNYENVESSQYSESDRGD